MIVDRSSRWGNPFTVADLKAAHSTFDDATAHQQVVDRFRVWLLGEVPDDQDVMPTRKGRTVDRRWMHAHLADLIGRRLCCPCPPHLACHADVLLDLVSQAAHRPL